MCIVEAHEQISQMISKPNRRREEEKKVKLSWRHWGGGRKVGGGIGGGLRIFPFHLSDITR